MTPPSRRAATDAPPAQEAGTFIFVGILPNTRLSTNTRGGDHWAEQGDNTNAERLAAKFAIRTVLSVNALPPLPWALTWTAFYPGEQAPDTDALAAMLKVWQDVLCVEAGLTTAMGKPRDGPKNIPDVRYRIRLRAQNAPCLTLRIEAMKGER